MDGRRSGALILTAALLFLVVATTLSRAGLPGRGFAPPPPPPPSVGDCVDVTIPPVTASSGPSPRVVYPALPTASCADGHYGEIATVLTSPAAAPAVAPDRNPYDPVVEIVGNDANNSVCDEAANSYVGLPPSTPPQTEWTETYYPLQPSIIAPTSQQRAAGQHWLACVASPDQGPAEYGYSVRNGYLSGYPVADAVGSCWQAGGSAPTVTQPTSCGVPHHAEVFGTIDNLDAIVGLQTSCAVLVGIITGLSDPTDGGRLSVQVVTDTDAGTRSCQLATTNPSRALDHSLRHLGGRPIPWA